MTVCDKGQEGERGDRGQQGAGRRGLGCELAPGHGTTAGLEGLAGDLVVAGLGHVPPG